MSKYKIIFKDGRETITGLTIDDAVNYKINNLNDAMNFDIAEMTTATKRKKKEEKPQTDKEKAEEIEQSRKEFMSSLSDSSRKALERGERKVKHSETEGWYLMVIPVEKPFFSAEEQKAKRRDRNKQIIKEYILKNADAIFLDIPLDDSELNAPEFYDLLKEIIK